jgi:hypothetical protein
MPRYVILNLADPGQMGPVTKVKSGLQVRVKNSARTIGVGDDVVPIHDLFDMLTIVKGDRLGNLGADFDRVRDDCDSAEKIFLCTHGTASDTEHGFAAATGGAPLGDWKDFGRLMRRLLPRKDKTYNLALVMCYGARTETYYARDLDHQGRIPASLLKTSFAYKFFKYLCDGHGRNIRMTARTGAVGFSDKTGASSVEQEAAIDIGLEKEEFLRQPKIQMTIDQWKAYKDAVDSDAKAAKFVKVDQKFKKNPNAAAKSFSSMERAGKAYHQMLARKNALEMQKFNYADLRKYGKIVYETADGGLRVINKYGSADTGIGPSTVLYEGPFL